MSNPSGPSGLESPEQRAQLLLRASLPPEEWQRYQQSDCVEVTAKSGRRYRIRGVGDDEHGDVAVRAVHNDTYFCIHPSNIYGQPRSDAVLGMVLMLRCDEETFLRVANYDPTQLVQIPTGTTTNVVNAPAGGWAHSLLLRRLVILVFAVGMVVALLWSFHLGLALALSANTMSLTMATARNWRPHPGVWRVLDTAVTLAVAGAACYHWLFAFGLWH